MVINEVSNTPQVTPASTTKVPAKGKTTKKSKTHIVATIKGKAPAEAKGKTKVIAKGKAPAKGKAAKPAADSGAIKVRLYAKGEFYFGRLAAERIGAAQYIDLQIKGKTITLTPTNSSKDTHKVMKCHESPVLRVARVLKDTGWSATTQNLEARAIGEKGMQVTIQ